MAAKLRGNFLTTPNIIRVQSFHKNGKRIIESKITSKSIATSMSTGVSAIDPISVKVVADIFMSIISCGIISGKPKMAMMAAFCCALAAMAAKKVNTRLRLNPPNNTKPTNGKKRIIGLPKNMEKTKKLKLLMSNMRMALKKSLANIKCCGEAIEL